MGIFNSKHLNVHCSMDDVLWIFKDITEHKEYTSIFQNTILRWMKEWHDMIGVKFTCYCFYNAWYNFTLSDTTHRFHNEFEANADWLKFGFHGYGFDELGKDRTYEKPEDAEILLQDYKLVTKELCRITSEKNIAEILRLSSFKSCEDGISLLKNEGVKGFLCAETAERDSYYLDVASKKKLYSVGNFCDKKLGVDFYTTGFRMEIEENVGRKLEALVKKRIPIVAFTHEWAFIDDRKKTQQNFEEMFEIIKGCKNKVKFF